MLKKVQEDPQVLFHIGHGYCNSKHVQDWAKAFGNNIKSYYQLAKETNFPYTTLLDLINGKGEKLTNIKIIATYFNVSPSYLIDDNSYFITINENNFVSYIKATGYDSLVSILLS